MKKVVYGMAIASLLLNITNAMEEKNNGDASFEGLPPEIIEKIMKSRKEGMVKDSGKEKEYNYYTEMTEVTSPLGVKRMAYLNAVNEASFIAKGLGVMLTGASEPTAASNFVNFWIGGIKRYQRLAGYYNGKAYIAEANGDQMLADRYRQQAEAAIEFGRNILHRHG